MALLLATSSLGCSNWMHDNDYRISGRTMDLGGFPTLDWALQTVPAGSKQPYGASTRGFVGFVPTVAKIEASFWVTGGLNDAGLSCDSQTLIEMEKAYVENEGSFKEALVALLTSDSFLYRK